MSSSRTLQITYVGMKSQDVPIKSGTIKVMMKSDSEVLQEVVVTGMQKMDKRLFTGATKQLNADNVKLDGLPDISRGLEGRAAGVSVQNVSGTFGTAPKIRVRGATSIYGSSKPLWVVDGVILEDSAGGRACSNIRRELWLCRLSAALTELPPASRSACHLPSIRIKLYGGAI